MGLTRLPILTGIIRAANNYISSSMVQSSSRNLGPWNFSNIVPKNLEFLYINYQVPEKWPSRNVFIQSSNLVPKKWASNSVFNRQIYFPKLGLPTVYTIVKSSSWNWASKSFILNVVPEISINCSLKCI